MQVHFAYTIPIEMTRTSLNYRLAMDHKITATRERDPKITKLVHNENSL